MPAEMTVELVSVERRLWSGDARFVLARTTVGEVGILPGHQPMLAQLEEAGTVRIDSTDGSKRTIAVHGGFLSVSAERVSILAEFAEQSDEIDVDRARRARDGADTSTDEGKAAVARAEARLRAAEAN
ncbi:MULTISPECIES: F0F1 ATP synthase subunit epsilon [unclassified Pseudonocardia]|uniref:F0F1 ATP synthase subunit epsilon n=2 Tax=Pseudonocardia TaxID=1847 RepID=UPI0002E61B56|nr:MULTISPECIES: F0F1 ATP synthase subunit epsilon [unclassified Pseudonocardia]OLM20418.1 ATP synthase epsilon chain [Pseudonocardia sp. Ae707_Ps1]